MNDVPPYILAAAQRLAAACPCRWSADDQNAVIGYLRQCAFLREEPPTGFPLQLIRAGQAFQLRKVRPPRRPA